MPSLIKSSFPTLRSPERHPPRKYQSLKVISYPALDAPGGQEKNAQVFARRQRVIRAITGRRGLNERLEIKIPVPEAYTDMTENRRGEMVAAGKSMSKIPAPIEAAIGGAGKGASAALRGAAGAFARVFFPPPPPSGGHSYTGRKIKKSEWDLD